MSRATGGGDSRRPSVPWVTLGLVAVAAVATSIPRVTAALEYDRARVAAGEIGRLIGASLTHWTARMAFWDLLVVAVAGAWIERRSRPLMVAVMLLGLAATAAAVHVPAGAIDVYRGSSGVATALFVAAAVLVFADAETGTARALAVVALLLMAAKVVVESTSGVTVAAGTLPPGVRVVARVHVAGAAAGATAVAIRVAARRGRA